MGRIKLFLLVSILTLSACNAQETPQQTPAATLDIPTGVPATPTDTRQAPTETPGEPAATGGEPTPTSKPEASGPVTYVILPGESKLRYEVGEVFLNQNNRFNLAVGVTTAINGEIQIDPQNPRNSSIGTITADIQFTSDSPRRDNTLRNRFIESARFPNVTFSPTEIEGLPDNYQDGQEIPLKITGDLTIREVTRQVAFDALLTLTGDTMRGEATTTILMSNFGFGPISIAGILNTEDEAKITLTFIARP